MILYHWKRKLLKMLISLFRIHCYCRSYKVSPRNLCLLSLLTIRSELSVERKVANRWAEKVRWLYHGTSSTEREGNTMASIKNLARWNLPGWCGGWGGAQRAVASLSWQPLPAFVARATQIRRPRPLKETQLPARQLSAAAKTGTGTSSGAVVPMP